MTMSQAEDLAKKFEDANAMVVASIEACGEAEWGATSGEEGWPAAVLAHHIAGGHQGISGIVAGVGAGGFEMPITPEQLDGQNAEHAKEFAGVDKATVLDLARTNGAAAAAALRAMSDAQLGESAEVFGQPMTAAQVTENILIGHALGHLESFKAATGQS